MIKILMMKILCMKKVNMSLAVMRNFHVSTRYRGVTHGLEYNLSVYVMII